MYAYLSRVQKYFYEDDEFTKTFENFVMEECGVIDLTSDEYKLEVRAIWCIFFFYRNLLLQYTEAFEKYKLLFERKLESFIRKQGCTPLDFFEALKHRTEEDPDGVYAIFGQILVAVIDFDIFMVMMKETAQSNARSVRK
jgi:hypothetical protein